MEDKKENVKMSSTLEGLKGTEEEQKRINDAYEAGVESQKNKEAIIFCRERASRVSQTLEGVIRAKALKREFIDSNLYKSLVFAEDLKRVLDRVVF